MSDTAQLIEALLSQERNPASPQPNDERARKMRQLVAELAESRTLAKPEDLKLAYERFQKRNQFTPGQLVRWKAGMKNRRIPDYKEPAIVIQVLGEPILNPSDESGTPYFREPLDLIVGVLDKDGDLLCFHFDSRRLEPWAE